MRACAVGDVGGYQIDHQQSPVGVDRDMTLSVDDFLAGVIAACLAMRGFDRLTVDHAADGSLRDLAAPDRASVDIMDRLEQQTPRQPAKPTVDRPPVTEMHRQHPPAAARAHEIAHRVDNFAKLDFMGLALASGLRHQRRDPLPFFVRQVRRIALGFPGDPGYSALLLMCPHPKYESHSQLDRNPKLDQFSNRL